jgi:hypothetical protein
MKTQFSSKSVVLQISRVFTPEIHILTILIFAGVIVCLYKHKVNLKELCWGCVDATEVNPSASDEHENVKLFKSLFISSVVI